FLYSWCCFSRAFVSCPTRRSSDLLAHTTAHFMGVIIEMPWLQSDLSEQPLGSFPDFSFGTPSMRTPCVGELTTDPHHGVERIHRYRKSTRLNSSHVKTSYVVFCLK